MEMEVVDLSTPEPGSTADLRERLQRAVARLTENRDRPGQVPHERTRLTGKIEGVMLILTEVEADSTMSPRTLRGRAQSHLDHLKGLTPPKSIREQVQHGGRIEGVKLALSYIHEGERITVADDRPGLAVTPAFVQRFANEYRWMIQEQTKPLGQRDPLPAVRVYAVATVLADMLRASGVSGVPEDDAPAAVLSALRDLLGMSDDQPFADAEELVHAGGPEDTATLCGEPVTDDTLVAIQDWRGHVTCRACREAAEL